MRVRGLPGLLCLALVVSLSAFLWGGVALAGFSDVTGNHWAAMNIEKMNARGVIGGYPDGSFQPNKTVSQVEAVCMAVRALGLQASAPGNLPDITFPVPGWAESDVKLAVRHGLLKSSDQFSAYSGLGGQAAGADDRQGIRSRRKAADAQFHGHLQDTGLGRLLREGGPGQRPGGRVCR